MKFFKLTTPTILVLCVLSTTLFGQLNHPKKNYWGEDEKLYWNKSLPVYVRLATGKDDGAETFLLKSDSTAEFAEPYYFDTEGRNFMRTRWAVDQNTRRTITPKIEVVWEVYADGVAPHSTIKYIHSGKHVVNGKTYYNGDLKISLSAYDRVSGVEGVYYGLNGSDYKKYENEINFPQGGGDMTLGYYAVDKVGNVEPIKEAGNGGNNLNFTIDTSAPVSSLDASDPKLDEILSPKTKVTISSSDDGSGTKRTYYAINEGKERLYSGPINISMLGEGDYKIDYYSVDHVNNKETPKSFDFYLDKTPPEVTFSIEGDQSKSNHLYISQRSKLFLTSSDNKSGIQSVRYNLNGGEFQDYAQPITIDLKEGYNVIKYLGIDKVENKSGLQAKGFYVDLTPPTIKFSIIGPKFERKDTLFVQQSSLIKITPYEIKTNNSGVDHIFYQVNNQPEERYENPFSVTSEGLKKVKFRVTDKVQNQAELSQIFFVDNTAPEIFHHYSADPIGNKTVRDKKYTIYPKEVILYLAATDDHVGSSKIYYSLGKTEEKLYQKPIQYFKNGKNIMVKVRAVDFLGNESTDVFEFTVED